MADTSKLTGLNSVLKDIAKKFGDSVVKYNVDELVVDGILSLGSPSADFAIYGGVPEGRIVELFGAEGSGKTTTAFLIAASYQREEIKRNPDNPRAIVFLDNEGTADPVWAKKLGYDMGETAIVPTICIRPEGQSAEDIFDMALNMLKTGEVGLLIFDSIATLVPQQIANESMTQYQIGGVAKSLTRFANTAIGLLRKYKATLIAINQVRERMDQYGEKEITPGGRAWKHACSMRLKFKRGDFFDEEGKELKVKDANSPAGHIIEMFVAKTKVCKWDRKLAYYHLNYVSGIDILQDTIDTSINLGLIDNSTQGSYVITVDDVNEKIRGKANLNKYLNEHKDVWKKLYDRCYELMAKKDDPYIKSFEEMLNINLGDKFDVDMSNEESLEEM